MFLPGRNRIRPIEPAEPRIASQRRGICCSARRLGKHALAQPGLAAAITDQFVWFREMHSRNGRTLRETTLLHRADEFGRLVLKRVGIVGVDRQDGVAGFGVFEQRVRQPGREFVERIAWRMTKTQELKRFVTPERFDVSCAGAIRALGNLADERRGVERGAAVCDRTDDEQPLTRLEVERDFDGEIAVVASVESWS